MIADARPPVRQLDLPRWCRCEDGTPKKAFVSRVAARDYARRVWGDSTRVRQYRCPACKSYHNTTRRSA